MDRAADRGAIVNQGAPDHRASGVSRVVLVDKPAGWTSYDVVRRAKRVYKGKIGHAGTLDPFATGLLLLLFGQATRVSSLFMDLPKEYFVTVQFGVVSSTGDPTGRLEHTGGRTDAASVLAVLDRFRGEILQRVPLTSAVKVDGERLYRKAHRGEEAETPERRVTVYDLTMVRFCMETQCMDLIARTGKGTYVRTLAEDIGETVGAGAHAAALRRTRIGSFSVARAVTPDQLSVPGLEDGDPEVALKLSEALEFLPSVNVSAVEARRVGNGSDLAEAPAAAGPFAVRGRDGLLAVYETREGRARPRVVFPAPEE